MQMPQRRFEGLSHLILEIHFGIVRHSMIMTVDRSELRLEEKGTSSDAIIGKRF
jgi:hypothetical protein